MVGQVGEPRIKRRTSQFLTRLLLNPAMGEVLSLEASNLALPLKAVVEQVWDSGVDRSAWK